jgi:large subunit ribosomal protein L31
MKANIHPNWNANATVTCACGNTFTTGSTHDAIKVDICSKCHPLFTGQQKFVDTLGQVDKFQKKAQESAQKNQIKKQILEARSQKVDNRNTDKPSLRDLLMQARKQA